MHSWQKTVPVGITLRLQGPTLEFILGRIFEEAGEEAAKQVFEVGSDELVREMTGQRLYDKGNCRLLGT